MIIMAVGGKKEDSACLPRKFSLSKSAYKEKLKVKTRD